MADKMKEQRMEIARKALAEGGGRSIYPRSNPYDINEGFIDTVSNVRNTTKADMDQYDRTIQEATLRRAADPLEMMRTYKGAPTHQQMSDNADWRRRTLDSLREGNPDGQFDRPLLEELEARYKYNPEMFRELTDEEYEQYVRQGDFPNELGRRSYEDTRQKRPEYLQQAADLRYAGAGHLTPETEEFMEDEDLDLSRLIDRGSHGDVRPEMAELAKEEADFSRESREAKNKLSEMITNKLLGR